MFGGCEAYVKKLQPHKLGSKMEKCIFVGYPKETIGYTNNPMRAKYLLPRAVYEFVMEGETVTFQQKLITLYLGSTISPLRARP
jgi:hypothetical protein